jgi:hypothetical protein
MPQLIIPNEAGGSQGVSGINSTPDASAQAGTGEVLASLGKSVGNSLSSQGRVMGQATASVGQEVGQTAAQLGSNLQKIGQQYFDRHKVQLKILFTTISIPRLLLSTIPAYKKDLVNLTMMPAILHSEPFNQTSLRLVKTLNLNIAITSIVLECAPD